MATQPDNRAKVFLSHIAEEAKLGIAVKDGLEDAFSRRIAVFVSSDPRYNPGGDSWLERIKHELKDPQACMLISLVSPKSVLKPWISIELGAAWILDRAVFPLCHSGQKLGALPRPMQDFGGADLTSDDAAERLIKAVEEATGLQVPKRWPVAHFLEEMRKGVAQTAAQPATTRLVETYDQLSGEQVQILRMLAVMKNRGSEGIPESEAPLECGIKPAVFTYHVNELVERDFANTSHWGVEGIHYSITAAGSGWLLRNNEMPE
jgi:hypothetical protein